VLLVIINRNSIGSSVNIKKKPALSKRDFMAEYQKIEYRIGKDGKIIETVINASGESCTNTTKGIEQALGVVSAQEFLPEYYEREENLTTETDISINPT
jgi:hypothetical protein